MTAAASRVALVTGANSGIGYEVARQLAAGPSYRLIILACRDPARAEQARLALERATGRRIFRTLTVDLSSAANVRAAALSLGDGIDDLVMNAGGGGGPRPLELTSDGVTNVIASNVFGHAVLLDALLQSARLRRAAIYVGSEAARGAPALHLDCPVLADHSVAGFTSICDGSSRASHPPHPAMAYAEAKLIAALWMSALARRHPGLKLLTVSPGNTSGTAFMRDFPPPLRLFLTYVFMPFVAPRRGLAHDVRTGAGRILQGLDDPGCASGGFYASEPDRVTGPLVEQGPLFPQLADEEIQDNAAAAIDRLVRSASRTALRDRA
jgi:NAD(P)-dependent dehydrogenase (short-subunit alcohol dehydrogenase family)